jgi:hypothetical protein
MVLLLFAATDLSFPGSCGDMPVAPHTDLTVCGGSDRPAPGHAGDDCFCCSRTVRTTAVVAFLPFVENAPAPIADLPEPRPAAVRRLDHPPIA